MVSSLQESFALVALLGQGAAAVRDSAVHVPLSSTTGVLGALTNLANALVSLALIILVVAMVPAAVALRKASKKAGVLIDRLSIELTPLVERANRISDSVDYITNSIRDDVRVLSRTVRHVTDRVTNGLEASEQHAAELGALLRLAQEELEQAVVSTASTLHGVRAGVTALRGDLLSTLARRDHTGALENEDEASEHDHRAETRHPARRARGPQIRHHPVEEER